MIMPAQEPYTGMPARTRSAIGSKSSNSTASLLIVVDSPPGITNACTSSSSRGRRTGRAITSASASAARCSRTSPCRAKTPMVRSDTDGALPAALGEPVGLRDVVDVDADHRLAQPTRHLRDHVRVIVERRGLHDRRRALCRVAGLEDAGADKHALGAELHH